MNSVERLLSFFLLICFGVIAPVQGMPIRVCLLEKSPQAISADTLLHPFANQRECCQTCAKAEMGQTVRDCCFDVDQQSALLVPRIVDQQVAQELPAVILLTAEWIALLRPAVDVDLGYPPIWMTLIPVSGSERRAVLNIWTV